MSETNDIQLRNASGEYASRFAETYEETVEIICEQLALGTPLTAVCRAPGLPDPTTVWRWAEADPQTAQSIARAREIGHDAIAEDALTIADDKTGDPTRDKLRVDTRLKLLAKWNPKKYGESTQLRHADADGGKLDTAPLVNELMGLMGHKPQLTIESTARDVTPAGAKPSAFGKPLIEPGSAPRAKLRAAYRPRGAKDVGDLV